MGEPAIQPVPVPVDGVGSGGAQVRRSAGRRRPSGEPPPLPRPLQITGVGWLVGAVGAVGLSVVVFVGGLRGPAVAVTVADDAVVGWLAGLDAPGFVGAMRALAAMSSWWVLNSLAAALLVALLVLRRFRHLILWIVLISFLGLLVGDILGALAHRPR